ncbi:MAG: YggS family pyridoxal phosphate-dependent enzyme [Synechococcales bacterium]|nr:YggS family pyridoxal phosphate-dependent enzyme [Synechococcales bacterium]
MSSFNALVTRIQQFQQTIPPTVQIIAVTKQQPAAVVRAAYAAGLRHFGESRVQEAQAKQAELADLTDVTWHLIGQLQRNKVKKALQLFQWIHSIDRLELAQQIDRLAAEERPSTIPLNLVTGQSQNSDLVSRSVQERPQICLQVKLLPDPNKIGWEVHELWQALPQLNQLTHIQIRGLMVIPPLGCSDRQLSDYFQQAKQLAQQITANGWENLQLDQLSMGMSDDYNLAIKAGATMIRPGRILFGDRQNGI